MYRIEERDRRVSFGLAVVILTALLTSTPVALSQELFETVYPERVQREVSASEALGPIELAEVLEKGKVRWVPDAAPGEAPPADEPRFARLVFVLTRGESVRTLVSDPTRLGEAGTWIDMKDSDFVRSGTGLAEALREFGLEKDRPGGIAAIWGSGGIAVRSKPHLDATFTLPGLGKLTVPTPSLKEGQLGISVVAVPEDPRRARRADLRPAMIVIDLPGTG
ncbi:MAG: hypothetical protein R3326_09805 [Gemmatimonadota bacterium]|nr:hypothetical protein [Gemmatimonadota bacterium]